MGAEKKSQTDLQTIIADIVRGAPFVASPDIS